LNYLKIYYRIIENSKKLSRDGYLEIHHIVPRSIFGQQILDESNLSELDDPKNLVALTAREHFIVHWLLAREFPNNKQLVGAFWAMSNFAKPESAKRNYIVSSRTFEEARKLFSNSKFKPIIQYSLTGEFIKVFDSRTEAALELNIRMSGFNKNFKSSGGFIWRNFKEDFPNKIDPYSPNDASKPIVQLSPDANYYIKTFSSAVEASEILGIGYGHISSCCNNQRNSSGGYKWIFEEDYEYNLPLGTEKDEYYQKLALKLAKDKSSIAKHKSVIQYDLQGNFIRIFKSIIEASKNTNTDRISIGNCCRGKLKSANEYMWQFYNGTIEAKIISYKRNKRKDSYKVGQYSLDGILLNVYSKISDVSNISDISSVLGVFKGRSKTASGFQWKKYNGEKNIPPIIYNSNRGRNVLQIDSKTGEILNEFSSLTEACLASKFSKGTIGKALKGKLKTAYGFIWQYK
jgi:hypothetical protein